MKKKKCSEIQVLTALHKGKLLYVLEIIISGISFMP